MIKKILLCLLIIIVLFNIFKHEDKSTSSIIPEGRYDIVESVSTDGIKTTRDDYEEEDYNVESMKIVIWKNNKAMLSFADEEKHLVNLDLIVNDEYLTNEKDSKDKVKYKYTNNQIELTYDSGLKEVYIKEYQDKLNKRYKEMIGHYELTSITDKEGENIPVTDKLKKELYLNVLENKKATLNGYLPNEINYSINENHFYARYTEFSKTKMDYIYDNNEITLTNFEQTKMNFKKID